MQRRRKIRRKSDNFQERIFQKLLSWFPLNSVCQVVYMESIKYINLIEIDCVVIEIWGVENGDLAVPVNNTLVCHMSFLAPDTRPCVLIFIHAGDTGLQGPTGEPGVQGSKGD